MNNNRSSRRISNSRRGHPVEREWRQKHIPGQRGEVQARTAEDEQKQEPVPRGTCLSMCPVRELQHREAHNLLHRFEVLTGCERDRRPRADPLRMVKEYARPAAGKDSTRPSELRPPAVLLKTVCYLIDNIATSPDLHPLTDVYDFVFDRLRSVRQDMIIQRMSGSVCVAILERTVRFLVYSSYQLCGEPLRLYDPRINDTHLQESLSWLLECYSSGHHPNQEQFQALSLLYNLGSGRAAQHTMELPERIRSSSVVSLALSVNRAFMERNPVRLLRLARRLDFLQSCALHRHLPACRRHLLLIYSHGHSSKNSRFPLPKLADILALDIRLTARLCQAYGVGINGDAVVFSKTSFTEPEVGRLRCPDFHELVEKKQSGKTIGGIIHGCA